MQLYKCVLEVDFSLFISTVLAPAFPALNAFAKH